MRLVIVESPNKVAKVKALLGAGYEVAATAGHFRDLPEDALGVELGSFRPTYVVDAKKAGLLERLKKLAATADEILLATDADREGEAIAWHLSQVLRHPRMRRVRFQEITAKALRSAVAGAGPVDQALVDAQQARRVLDRLVGYQISPLLGAFGSNHSAGRVQSAALHLVVEREKAREGFKVEAFWTVTALYESGMRARHVSRNAKGEWTDSRFRQEADAEAVRAKALGVHVVESVDVVGQEVRPKPPFTTSTLQQAASVLLKMRPGRTMAVAQALFEQGLITYHRTDSVALSAEAIAMARARIQREHPEALPTAPVQFPNRASAQEAHEAIRPTHDGGAQLSGQEAALYDLIVRRFLACQCRPAKVAITTVLLQSPGAMWRARGRVVREPHWLHYLPADEESERKSPEVEDDEAGARIPQVLRGERQRVKALEVKGGQTKPPPRFTQASLVRELERLGIGRPSTYASIVDDQEGVLFEREYLAEEKRTVLPTPRGRLIDAALLAAFPDLVDAPYTAQMEARLDEVARGRCRWGDELGRWYPPFAKRLLTAPGVFAGLAKEQVLPEIPRATGRPCPLCGKELFLRQGKKGAYLSCSGYPSCRFTTDPGAVSSKLPCPKCQGPMEELEGRYGRYARCLERSCGGRQDLAVAVDQACPACGAPLKDKGAFLGCSGYPTCRFAADKTTLAQARKAGRTCPKCQGLLLLRKGAKGAFWGCSKYPACKHVEAK